MLGRLCFFVPKYEPEYIVPPKVAFVDIVVTTRHPVEMKAESRCFKVSHLIQRQNRKVKNNVIVENKVNPKPRVGRNSGSVAASTPSRHFSDCRLLISQSTVVQSSMAVSEQFNRRFYLLEQFGSNTEQSEAL